MTPAQQDAVCAALNAIPSAEFYESLKRDAIVAVMGTLVCEEASATEIFEQMERDGIVRTELTPRGDPNGLEGPIPTARLKFLATHN